MVLHNTTEVPSLGLHSGPACEAGLSAGMRREHVPPQKLKIKDKERTSDDAKIYKHVHGNNDQIWTDTWLLKLNTEKW